MKTNPVAISLITVVMLLSAVSATHAQDLQLQVRDSRIERGRGRLCDVVRFHDQLANVHYQQPEPQNWEPHDVHWFVSGELPPGTVLEFAEDETFDFHHIGTNDGRAGKEHYQISQWAHDPHEPEELWKTDPDEVKRPRRHPWPFASIMYSVTDAGELFMRVRIDAVSLFHRGTFYVGDNPKAAKPYQQVYVTNSMQRVMQKLMVRVPEGTEGEYELHVMYQPADGQRIHKEYRLRVK